MNPRLRSAVPLLAAAAAVVGIGVLTNAHYPLREWLLIRVAGYWLLSAYWGLGCLALGAELVGRIAPRRHRVSEVALIGFPLGVLAFGFAVFLAGIGRRLGVVFFVLAPGGFIVAGYPALRRIGASLRERFRAPVQLSRLEALALVFGAVGLVAAYVPILTPHNIQHDARWYHLPIAEQYAATGAIARFPEGWFLGTYPHLSSLLYAWALLLPAGIVHRIELCAHLEFLMVLATLAALPALIRRIFPGARMPFAWAGVFLFPSFLIYDSNVSTGADHVAALFAPAGLLALYPALRALSARDAALVGALAGGAALTKYSAICIVVPLLGAVVVRTFLYTRRRGYGARALTPPAVMMGAFLVAWSPHWLKNLVWYGDPLYPHGHAYFRPRPWDGQAEIYLRVFMEFAVLRPTRDLSGVLDSAYAAATLGFRTHETFGLRGDIPLFGFLFAATLYCVPFLRVGARLWVAEGLAFSSVFVWYWTNHRDRYLQACLPWLVAVTVAVLRHLWQSGRAGRGAAALLVGTQVVLGAGIWLLPLHVMVPGRHPVPKVIDLVRAGYEGRYAERFQPFAEWGFADWVDLGRRLPESARVLVHEDRLWVGLDRAVVVDEAQWQAGIRYMDLKTPSAVYDELRPFGVTHVVTGQSHGDSGGHGVAGDLVFWSFLTQEAKKVVTKGRLTLWQMPAARPPDRRLGTVLLLTCNQSLTPGLYDFESIIRGSPRSKVAAKGPVADHALALAELVVLENDCGFTTEPRQLETFEKMAERGPVSFLRRRAVSAAP